MGLIVRRHIRWIAALLIAALFTRLQWAMAFELDLQMTEFVVGPLFFSWVDRLASCVAVFCVLFSVISWPVLSGGHALLGVRLARSASIAAVIAFLHFEFCYLISRIPPLSPVSLSLAFRPWQRILPIAAVTFLIFWIPLFIFMRPSRPTARGIMQWLHGGRGK